MIEFPSSKSLATGLHRCRVDEEEAEAGPESEIDDDPNEDRWTCCFEVEGEKGRVDETQSEMIRIDFR